MLTKMLSDVHPRGAPLGTVSSCTVDQWIIAEMVGAALSSVPIIYHDLKGLDSFLNDSGKAFVVT